MNILINSYSLSIGGGQKILNDFLQYLQDIIVKNIAKIGQHVNISYKSKFSGNEEIMSLDLDAIEFKIHGAGSNQANMIL